MSCRVHTGRTDVQPIQWKQAGAAAAVAAPIRPTASPAGVEPDVRALEVAAERRAREAHDAGFQAGQAAAARQIETAAAQFAKALADVSTYKTKLRREAERDLVELSLAIAKRVLMRELQTDPDALEGIVHAALERIQSREAMCVRMHPDHAAAVQRQLHAAGASHIAVQADASLAQGTIRFETPRGVLDASVDAQLQEIGRGLADRLRG